MKIPDFLKEVRISERELRELARRSRIPLRRGTKKLKKEWVRKMKEDLARKREQEKGKNDKNVGKGKKVEIPYRVQVKTLAEILDLSVMALISELIKNGIMATVNEEVDYETAAIIAQDLGFKTEEKKIDEEKEVITAEKLQKIIEEDQDALMKRAPIVTIMGHVDHGKTTLLDAIRETEVVDGEHGGITQHIGAYQTTIKKGKFKGNLITFLDTPGHEAFVSMRERGANSTDIAILVVAADDGVKPQTIESIKHAKNAKVPIIVAINKMDKPGANPTRVKQELSEHEIQTEEWGGDVPSVEISAKNKEGLEELLEMILLVTEVADLKANPERLAMGTVVEANLDKERGPIATLLVQTGTLRLHDNVTIGHVHGKVRSLEDYKGNKVKEAGPSMPVQIIGLYDVPSAGDIFQAISEKKGAWEKAKKEQTEQKMRQRRTFGKVSMRRINQSIQAGMTDKLHIILKTDVQGSLEAIMQVLETIKHDEVEIHLLHAGVGSINESDVQRARSANAIVVGFNIGTMTQATKLAEELDVPIMEYNVIYQLIEDVKGKLGELLKPETIITSHGKMKIIAIFKRGRGEMIVGGKVTKGVIKNKTIVKVVRNKEEIGEGEIIQLQNKKQAATEVREGLEAGITFKGDIIIEEGDQLECITKTEKRRKIA